MPVSLTDKETLSFSEKVNEPITQLEKNAERRASIEVQLHDAYYVKIT